MKGIILLISFLILAIHPLKASSDSVFSNANKLYQDGRYEDAILAYESVINSGYESATLYYNLGNSYFRSNKLGNARLYYEKALKLNPDDEDAQANIQYLEGLLSDRFEEVPIIFYKKWINSIYISLSSNQWAYISMILFVISILSVSVYLLLRNTLLRKTGFYSGLLFLLLSILSLTASWKQYQQIKKPDSAVVIDLSVNVKSAPRETGTGLFVLHEGAKVWLEDKTSGWQEIRLSDGRKGWLPVESIQSI
jgi:tetratricopeptide (TPR) repeat protein